MGPDFGPGLPRRIAAETILKSDSYFFCDFVVRSVFELVDPACMAFEPGKDTEFRTFGTVRGFLGTKNTQSVGCWENTTHRFGQKTTRGSCPPG